MELKWVRKAVNVLAITVSLLLLTSVVSFAAIEFDTDAIEARIVAAVAGGADPALAAKEAVANAVRTIVAANPEYPGGKEALNAAIIEALGDITIEGLDDTDLFVAANHALGNKIDAALEAYEAPGAAGRENARGRGGNAYGPGGKPRPGSPT